MLRVSKSADPLPSDIETLQAMIVAAWAERDTAIAERACGDRRCSPRGLMASGSCPPLPIPPFQKLTEQRFAIGLALWDSTDFQRNPKTPGNRA